MLLISNDNSHTWTIGHSKKSWGLNRIFFGNSTFIVVGNYGTILQSDELVTNPWGDVNNDAKTDLGDVIVSLQVLSSIDTTGNTITILADTNSDGKIGLQEVIYLLQKVAGMR